MQKRILLIIFTLLFTLPSWAMDRTTQRADFTLALSSLNQGDEKTFQKLSAKLTDYPLYPYLRYAYLKKHIDTTTDNDVQTFLTQYADTPLASRLWVVWLESLAEKKNWSEFLSKYRPTSNETLQCLSREALLKTGQKQAAFNDINLLWLEDKSQPAACKTILNQWELNDGLTLNLLWQKIYLAMAKTNFSVINQLITIVPVNQRWVIELWNAVYNKPQLLEEHQLLDNTEPVTQFILNVGMQKLANHNPNIAIATWLALQQEYLFTAVEQQEVAKIIGVALAANGDPHAIDWLAQAGNDNSDQSAALWRVRFALIQQNWPAVLTAIAQLPADQQKQSTWRYWQARALNALGQTVNANAIYHDLASSHDYYGQLAAMQLNKRNVYPIIALPSNTQQLQQIANISAMQRSYELYQLNLKSESRSEWEWGLKSLPNTQYLAASQLALQWGWYDCAIATNQLLGDQGDITLRYPVAYKINILNAAKSNNINPAWMLAEIRQESLFQTQAHSNAGAYGLMQLMPNTALLLANKLHIHLDNNNSLFDYNDNIVIGGNYLQKLLIANHGNIVLATASYNAGPERVKKWREKVNQLPADIFIETLPWHETRDYVKNIMASTTLYEEELGQPTTFSQRLRTAC